jgi:hypothetical protein
MRLAVSVAMLLFPQFAFDIKCQRETDARHSNLAAHVSGAKLVSQRSIVQDARTALTDQSAIVALEAKVRIEFTEARLT